MKHKSSRTIYYIIDSWDDSYKYVMPKWIKIESGYGTCHPQYRYFQSSQHIMKAEKAFKFFLYLKIFNKADIDLIRVISTKSGRRLLWLNCSEEHKRICKKRKGRRK